MSAAPLGDSKRGFVPRGTNPKNKTRNGRSSSGPAGAGSGAFCANLQKSASASGNLAPPGEPHPLALALAAVGLAALALAAPVLSGCAGTPHGEARVRLPPALLAQARPIGRGPRFHLPARGPVPGRCARRLGPRAGVHVELFAANRVVLVPTGIGTRPPRTFSAGRISAARCYGELVTLDPTGLVLVRAGRRPPLSALFRAWGQPLSARQLGPFEAPPGTRVAVFVDGRRRRGSPRSVPLAAHAEIVLEVGPHVPPHSSYTFPPGT